MDKLPANVADQLLLAIQSLSKNPRPAGCKKLRNRNAYRVRTGNYRIIYEIFDDILLIDVIAVGHRKNIYRKY
ncbi:MAG: type II toxin-antitoxin system RelE/ParE family toxin [Bacteroidota bacterium]|nr:type II toxin-antitoxin system RelE/ParE family toxin [Bacteroidota bacterium]